MPKEEEEDSELEEIIEEEALEEVAEEIGGTSPSEFDDNALLKFLAENESASPSLERTAVAQDEVRLERVAQESPKEEEPTRKKDYSINKDYELNEEYSDSKRKYDEDTEQMNIRVRNSIGESLGLQEIKREDSEDKYIAPTDLERIESGDAQKYHSRKFK